MADGFDGIEDEETTIITLNYDDGTSEECEVIGVFGHDGSDYIALGPVEDEDDVYLYRYHEGDDETFSIAEIEDDLFDSVAETYTQIMEEATA